MPAILSSRDESNSTQITAFNILAFLGVFLNVAALAPALFLPTVHRRTTWYGLVTSWIIYSTSYLLLLGRQTGPEPPFGLCICQAALIYAAPSLCGIGTATFAIDFYLQTTEILFHSKKVNPKTATLLVLSPWLVFAAVFLEVLLVVQNPSSVERDPTHFYCRIASPIPPMTSAIIILLVGSVVLPLEIYTATILYRNWRAFRRLSMQMSGISLSSFIRLAFFTFVEVAALGLSAFIIPRINESVATWSIMLITLPTIAAIAFGTQGDILKAWMVWRERTPPAPLRRASISSESPLILNKRSTLIM